LTKKVAGAWTYIVKLRLQEKCPAALIYNLENYAWEVIHIA
jgi:hypothetical protein